MIAQTTTIDPQTQKYLKSLVYDTFAESINNGKIVDSISIILEDNNYNYFNEKSRKDYVKFCNAKAFDYSVDEEVKIFYYVDLLSATYGGEDKFKSHLNTEEGVYFAIKYRSLNDINGFVVSSFCALVEKEKLVKKDVEYFIEVLLSIDCYPARRPSFFESFSFIPNNFDLSQEYCLKIIKYFIYSDFKFEVNYLHNTIFFDKTSEKQVVEFMETIDFSKVNSSNMQVLAEIFSKNYMIKSLELLIKKGYTGMAHIIRCYIDNISDHKNYDPRLMRLVLQSKPRKPSQSIVKSAFEALYDLERYKDFYKNLNLSPRHIVESKIEDLNALLKYAGCVV
jgi:hypothetical protein